MCKTNTSRDIFTYGTPESVGISSAALADMFEELRDSRFLSHSFLVARHGRIVSEGYFAPFTKDSFHRMYSTTKTFVATAIGLLIDEGRVSLDDKIVKFFPDKVTEKTHPYIMETTVRDLLTMSTPFTCGATYSPHRDDWVDSFFTTEPDHPAGTLFFYDTAGSFLLNVIVERLTGKPFVEYLKDKLLRAAGFSEEAWCVGSPDGYSWGGSGGEWTTRDLARLGQIYLNRGVVHGEQLLSRAFCEAAVSRQVDNNPTGHLDRFHGYGYGYQIWCLAEGCFGFLGMGGQVMLACPELDLLIATTSDEQGASYGYSYLAELFYRYLVHPLRAAKDAPIAENPEAHARLLDVTSHLRCRLPMLGECDSPVREQIDGVPYRMGDNRMGIEWLRVDFDAEGGTLVFFARGEEKRIEFGLGEYRLHAFPETQYFGRAIRTPKGEGYRTMSGALFTEPRKLVIRSYLIDDYYGNLTVTLGFKGDEVTVYMTKTAEWFLEEYHGIGVGRAERA